MKETTGRLLKKAERSIAAVKGPLASGNAGFAASRAYHAMFYVAEALLSERDLRFRKHGGVHAAFAEAFAKTGELDPKYHRWLLAAFNKRIAGDYEVGAEITVEEVRIMTDQARQFLVAGKRCLHCPS